MCSWGTWKSGSRSFGRCPSCRSYASQFCSVYGIAYPNSARVNIDGCFCSRYKDFCSNTLLTFICQATTITDGISVGPQTPVWNLQSLIIVCKRCEVRDRSDRSRLLCETESFNFS